MEEWRVFELVQTVLFLGAFVLVAYSPLPRAIGNRILHGRAPRGLPSDQVERVDDLSGEVAALRQQLGETQERLDFTERMLAQARQTGALPGAR